MRSITGKIKNDLTSYIVVQLNSSQSIRYGRHYTEDRIRDDGARRTVKQKSRVIWLSRPTNFLAIELVTGEALQ